MGRWDFRIATSAAGTTTKRIIGRRGPVLVQQQRHLTARQLVGQGGTAGGTRGAGDDDGTPMSNSPEKEDTGSSMDFERESSSVSSLGILWPCSL
ncbi:uncharacterized protein J3R85_018130 [Psidium guajava]|nr:uncharacterized protein J3R85_018130 [Psidium guajava]